MKIDAKITNLGKLKNGLIKIRPLTVLAGKNGTGKSFVTKSLYSIFNVINKNIYHINLRKYIATCKIDLKIIEANLIFPGQNDITVIRNIEQQLDKLSDLLDHATEELELEDYFSYTKQSSSTIIDLISYFNSYIDSLLEKQKKLSSIKSDAEKFTSDMNKVKDELLDGKSSYVKLLQENISNEVKENFQVSDVSQLVTFGEKSLSVDINDIAHIEFGGKPLVSFSLQHEFIRIASSLSRVVFFESPAYWKVREALKLAKSEAKLPLFIKKKSNKLTGVPKYFYDLDEALKENFKNESTCHLEELANNLANNLGGEFFFNGDELVFKDKASGREISKNLISFGMTNIGMIHSLLKNNIISQGSFVFIDEPETNLHPEWQVLLMETLLKLAENNINIVIATHSVDMLKAIEVNLNECGKMTDDFLSIHYFDTDGTLLKFDSTDIKLQLIEAKDELSSPYQTLFFRG